MLIQKLRLQHGWSQQQLAELSGLSARTIQRIEAGQPASVETLKSLAAVFGVDFSTLQPEEKMETASLDFSEREEKDAFEYVRKLRGFYSHLLRYLVVNAFLVAIYVFIAPHKYWVLWVIGGWGIGLLIHAIRVFGRYGFFGPDWERRQVEKRLGRPL